MMPDFKHQVVINGDQFKCYTDQLKRWTNALSLQNPKLEPVKVEAKSALTSYLNHCLDIDLPNLMYLKPFNI